MTPFRLPNPFHARKPEPAPVATIRNPEQVVADIRTLLIKAGECIESGRIQQGKQIVDDLIIVLGRGDVK